MDKEDVVCMYNGIFLNHNKNKNKNKRNLAICNNMDGSGRYYIKYQRKINT